MFIKSNYARDQTASCNGTLNSKLVSRFTQIVTSIENGLELLRMVKYRSIMSNDTQIVPPCNGLWDRVYQIELCYWFPDLIVTFSCCGRVPKLMKTIACLELGCQSQYLVLLKKKIIGTITITLCLILWRNDSM